MSGGCDTSIDDLRPPTRADSRALGDGPNIDEVFRNVVGSQSASRTLLGLRKEASIVLVQRFQDCMAKFEHTTSTTTNAAIPTVREHMDDDQEAPLLSVFLKTPRHGGEGL